MMKKKHFHDLETSIRQFSEKLTPLELKYAADRLIDKKSLSESLSPYFASLPTSRRASDLFVSSSAHVSRSKKKRNRKPRLFISHSHADKRFVRSLATRLKQCKIEVWVDEAEIRHGDSLIEKLRAAIDQVDLVLAVISPASIRSKWVQKELDIAMNQEIRRKRVKVIPLLRNDCVLPGFIDGKLYADFTNRYRQIKNFQKLVDSIKEHCN